MRDQPFAMRLATLIGTWLMVLLVGVNTCAVDRLERQVIRNRELIESRGGSVGAAIGGGGAGTTVRGWGGQPITIERVSGAPDDAPLRLSDKPRPQGDVYVQRQSSPPGTLNYYATNDGITSRLSRYTLEGMVDIDPRDPETIVPSLATSWEVSDDRLTYTYHLRKGVKFADGRPFTSRDVAFTFAVMRDPAVNAEHVRGNFEQVQSLEAPDPHTVVVTYRNRDWRGLASVGYNLRVLNAGWFEEQIPKYAADLEIEEYSTTPGTPGFGEVFNKIRVPGPGTGPYYLPGGYDPSRPIDLVQHPAWWGIQVHPERWNLSKYRTIFIDDDVAAFEEFRKGNFDVMVIDAAAWDDQYSQDEELRETTTYYSYDHMGIGFSAITWNARQPPFDDPRVRRAMTLLTDRQWILDEVQRGRGQIGFCHGKPSYKICQAPGLEPLPYDPEQAERLLAEAGWTDSDGDGVLDRDGERFEVEIKVGSPRRFYSQVVGLLQDSPKKVGIRMTMRTLEWATFIEDYYERRFDAAVLYHSFQDPWISPYEAYHSSQDVPRGGNAPGWRDDEVDDLLERMREEFDEQKRVEMYWEFDRRFQEAQPRTVLIHSKVSVLQNNRFEGVEVLPTGLRFNDYWVEPENVKHPR